MKIDLNKKYRHVFFIGIGGISMSGLAEILYNRGLKVSGSDMNLSDTVKHLKEKGIPVYIGHDPKNIEADVDLVVYTAAIKNTNPEYVEAEKRGIPICDRAELLGEIMHGYTYPVAVAGTHGKTTTTSMISEILLCANADPTITVGGVLPSINGNLRLGGNKYFIAEACEYFDSFLKFNPYISVILNIEADHLDYFKNLEAIRKSFKAFAEKTDKDGVCIVNSQIDNYKELFENIPCKLITYGNTESSDWKAENIETNSLGLMSFDACFMGRTIGRIDLNVHGIHNVYNALAACAAAYELGIDFKHIAEGLNNFKGTDRRFQVKGKFNGAVVIDDYAHHPTEIKATLSAAKDMPKNTLWCVFQPHTYSRTLTLLNDFEKAFDDADVIILADIYAAREKDTGAISSKTLCERIASRGKKAIYIDSFEKIEEYLKENCKPDDMIITMGAGNIYLVGEALVK